jgi:hypothetical protein
VDNLARKRLNLASIGKVSRLAKICVEINTKSALAWRRFASDFSPVGFRLKIGVNWAFSLVCFDGLAMMCLVIDSARYTKWALAWLNVMR